MELLERQTQLDQLTALAARAGRRSGSARSRSRVRRERENPACSHRARPCLPTLTGTKERATAFRCHARSDRYSTWTHSEPMSLTRSPLVSTGNRSTWRYWAALDAPRAPGSCHRRSALGRRGLARPAPVLGPQDRGFAGADADDVPFPDEVAARFGASGEPRRTAYPSTRPPALDLPPLSLDAVRTLSTGTAVDAEDVFRITGGNPFFVTEALRAPGEALPPTVRDAILSRVARLPEQAQSALGVAALMGADVEPHIP